MSRVDHLISLLERHAPALAAKLGRDCSATALADALATLLRRRELRGQNRVRRAAATDRELSRRHQELAARRARLLEEPRRRRNDLAARRLAAGEELAEAVRRLRHDARSYLETADHSQRVRFPKLFAEACSALNQRMLTRLDELFGVPSPASGRGVSPPPAPNWPRRLAAESRLLLLCTALGGVSLGRLALASGGVPRVLGAATVPVTVGLMVAAACWLTQNRRAVVERARLGHWVGEALADLRVALEAALNERVLAAERRLEAEERSITAQVAATDAALRAHQLLVHRLGADRAEREQADLRLCATLRAGLAELNRSTAVRRETAR